MRSRLIAAAGAVLLAGTLAACGSSTASNHSAANNSSGTSSAYGTGGSSASGSSSSQTVALITTKQHGKLGTILAYGSKKLTVYLFEADTNGMSHCSGACAAVWRPVTGSPKASSAANGSDLGTITRSDGTKQVTYNGHPLYTYVKDKDDGDVYGEGVKQFGAEWYVLSPSGNKVDLS